MSTKDTRAHILDTARGLMVNKGYTAVGLAELVAAAEVPKGSFYYYFKSKEEFGQALLERYFRDYLVTIDAILISGRGTALQRLLSYFRHWIDTQCGTNPNGKCLVVKLGPEVCDLSFDMQKILEKGTDAIVNRIEACIVAGRADHSIASKSRPHALAEGLYELWLGATLLAKVGKSADPYKAALETTKNLIH